MAVYRLQCAWQMDTAFPRDKVTINPFFQVNGALQDPDQLCEDLATALKTWSATTAQLDVKAYNAESAPPNFPVGEATRDASSIGTSPSPRELAVCLSFYADKNTPRRRGRLYVPLAIYFTGSSLSNRPLGTMLTKPADLVPIFATLGGVNVDWVVYSRADSAARKVSNYWVDNEWDTVRSRGMRPTTRASGATSG